MDQDKSNQVTLQEVNKDGGCGAWDNREELQQAEDLEAECQAFYKKQGLEEANNQPEDDTLDLPDL